MRGIPSEVALDEKDGMKRPCAVNLHNAVTVSQGRLGRRVARLSDDRLREVCAALRFSPGCFEAPALQPSSDRKREKTYSADA